MFTDRRGIFWVQYITFNNQVTGRKRKHISIIGTKVDIENAFKSRLLENTIAGKINFHQESKLKLTYLLVILQNAGL